MQIKQNNTFSSATTSFRVLSCADESDGETTSVGCLQGCDEAFNQNISCISSKNHVQQKSINLYKNMIYFHI
jgi:hypothetical protein